MGQLGAFLTGLYEQKQKREEEDKQRARKFKAMVEYADTAGIMSKDRALTMGVDELEGAVQGFSAKQQIEKGIAELAKAKAEQEDRNALLGFAQDFSQGTNAPMERFASALGRNPGAFASPQFDNSLNVLKAFAPEAQEDLTPGVFEVPDSGALFAYRGKQFLPAGFKPKAGGGDVKELKSPSGQLLGFLRVDARGREKIIKPPPNTQLSIVLDGEGKPLPGRYMDGAGKIHDFRSELEKWRGSEADAEDEDDPGFLERLFGKGKDAKAPAAAPAKASGGVDYEWRDGKLIKVQ